VCLNGQVEGAGADSGFTAALAATIRPQAITEYEKALTAVFNAGAEVCCQPPIHWADLPHMLQMSCVPSCLVQRSVLNGAVKVFMILSLKHG